MNKHTPTPWKYSPPQGAFGHEVVAGSELICQMSHHPDKQKQSQANAEFIVKACNSHYEVLNCLNSVLCMLLMADRPQDRDTIMHIQNTIKKATGNK